MMNNEQQHTPDPWRTTLNSNMERGIRTSGGFICFLPKPNHYHGQDERYKRDLITNEANANLIAAAPELLEALMAILKRFDSGHEIKGDVMCKVWVNKNEIEHAHAAIAKAVGWQTTVYAQSELNRHCCMGLCGQFEQPEPEINGADIMLDQAHADAPSPYDP